MSSFLKGALTAIALGIAGTISAAAFGYLKQGHLEVSFENVKEFNLTDLGGYYQLGSAIAFHWATASPRNLAAYWVIDYQPNSTLHQSDVSYDDFPLSRTIRGKIVDDDQRAYAIAGYYNDSQIVFSHHGTNGGTGVYTLVRSQIGSRNDTAYIGYGIFESQPDVDGTVDIKDRRQCPFVLVDRALVPSTEAARQTFRILSQPCIPFKMPTRVLASNAPDR